MSPCSCHPSNSCAHGTSADLGAIRAPTQGEPLRLTVGHDATGVIVIARRGEGRVARLLGLGTATTHGLGERDMIRRAIGKLRDDLRAAWRWGGSSLN